MRKIWVPSQSVKLRQIVDEALVFRCSVDVVVVIYLCIARTQSAVHVPKRRRSSAALLVTNWQVPDFLYFMLRMIRGGVGPRKIFGIISLTDKSVRGKVTGVTAIPIPTELNIRQYDTHTNVEL
jgi:hypothetical protein